jgi:hypothetical protein
MPMIKIVGFDRIGAAAGVRAGLAVHGLER